MIQAYKIVKTTVKTLQHESRDFETIYLNQQKKFVKWVNFQLETKDYSIEETILPTSNCRKNKNNQNF